VDVVALVRDVAAALAPQAEAKRIALSVNVPRHATVSASPGRIRQVLANLAGNAVKYTPEGGRVEMALTAEGEHVRVTVTDSGIGIPASALPYVFDKFYRVKSAATREIEGTGLGLAITKSIIEALGGRIWVESQEGRGSTFGFDLSAAP
jgi:signal transduction histidine kinase